MKTSFTILIVDDEELHRKLMTKIIVSLGHTTIEAGDGRTAVDLAVERLPNLILMDINLPVMSGLTATRLLKENPATRSIPIIALTAMAMAGDGEKVMDAGCDDYVIKPIRYKSFVEKLEDWLRTIASAESDRGRAGE